MSGHEPTDLERAVAWALAREIYGEQLASQYVDLDVEVEANVNVPQLARIAIAECFRHQHTDRSVPCPLCGFSLVANSNTKGCFTTPPFVYLDEP